MIGVTTTLPGRKITLLLNFDSIIAIENATLPLTTFPLLQSTVLLGRKSHKEPVFQKQTLLFSTLLLPAGKSKAKTKSVNSGANEFEENAIKPLSYPFLAGLLDGDGFIRTSKFTGEYVFTMHLEDKPFLQEIKSQFGGNIRKVIDKKACRLTINAKTAINGKTSIFEITAGLNGHVRNTIRVEQFKKLCAALSLEFKEPGPLKADNGYIAGLFVSDGTIFMNCRPSAKTKKEKIQESFSIKRSNPKVGKETSDIQTVIQRILNGVAPLIEVRIANRFLINVDSIESALCFGTSSFWKAGKNPWGCFAFFIKSEKHILDFAKYMSQYKTRSVKHKRLDLVQAFYNLKKQRAHLPNANSSLALAWDTLIRKWYSENLIENLLVKTCKI